MLEIISGGLSSLNAAMGLAKTLNAATTQAAINDIKLDLQERIFEAREALTAAREAQAVSLQRIRDLEDKISKMEQWEGNKENYELKRYWPGTFAYVAKPGMPDSDPPQTFCQPCFDGGKKSTLYMSGDRKMGYARMACPTCRLIFSLGKEMPPQSDPGGP